MIILVEPFLWWRTTELRRTTEELQCTRSELHRPRDEKLSVARHIAVV